MRRIRKRQRVRRRYQCNHPSTEHSLTIELGNLHLLATQHLLAVTYLLVAEIPSNIKHLLTTQYRLATEDLLLSKHLLAIEPQ